MKINVVGIGLEGKKSLTTSVLSIVNNANVLVGGDRHLNYFPEHQGIKLKINNLTEVIKTIKKYLQQEKNIVILATGDPLFFGIGRLLTTEFSSDKLEFYPHLSSVQLAFNKLQIPWQLAKIVSIHGRDINCLLSEWKKGVEVMAILTDTQNNPLVVWQLYQQLKLPIIYDFWLCENLGDTTEKTTKITDEKDIDINNLSSLNLLVLKQKKDSNSSLFDLAKLPLVGIDDNLFYTFEDRPGLITKREIRLLILGELELNSNQVVWDIGAGTGSVSIEIARISQNSQIYAIEKTTVGTKLITQNCQRFQVNNIEVINDYAEKMINQLPNVDRVFIGGSNGQIVTLLDIIETKINYQGKVVIALATLENLAIASQWFKDKKWQYNIMNVQINKSISIGNMTRFNPINPVNIIIAKPPENIN